MIQHRPHLTEEERQSMADGSLPLDREQALEPHLRACQVCAADVLRLRQVVHAARGVGSRDTTAPQVALDGLWPGIRARIQERQVVSMPRRADRRRKWYWAVAAGAAAAVVVLALSLAPRSRQSAIAPPAAVTSGGDSLMLVADSVRAYQEEAQILLDRLDLQRAMLEPGMRVAIDHDLAVVDSAIAELQTAIARDPNDPTLQRLLAMSYQRKVEILMRAEGTG